MSTDKVTSSGKTILFIGIEAIISALSGQHGLKMMKNEKKTHKNILHFQFDSMHLGVLHVLFISISVVKYHSQISFKSDHSLEYLTLYIPV